MVFLIQNTQNLDSEAMQVKLDELIRAVEGALTTPCWTWNNWKKRSSTTSAPNTSGWQHVPGTTCAARAIDTGSPPRTTPLQAAAGIEIADSPPIRARVQRSAEFRQTKKCPAKAGHLHVARTLRATIT
jgi:hypothetical protein